MTSNTSPVRSPLRSPRAAITLVELLIAMALIGIVLAAAGNMLLQAFTNESGYRQQNAAQQNDRTAIRTITDDMKGAARQVTVVTLGNGANAKSAVLPTNTVKVGTDATISSATNVTFSAPLTFNTYSDTVTSRTVYYWLRSNKASASDSGYELRRMIVNAGSAGPASETDGTVIARNVWLFTAQKPYTALSASIPNLNNYNVVRVIITTTEGRGSTNPSIVTVRADVMLRNNLL